MNSKLIQFLQRVNGWKLWTGIMVAALLAVEIIVALLDMFFYGHVISEDMIKGLVATAIVEPTHVFFMIYLMGEFSKGQIHNLESDVEYANRRFGVAVGIAQLNVWEMDIAKGELIYDEDALKTLGMQVDAAPHDLPGWLALVHPDDVPTFMEKFHDTMRPDGVLFDYEYRIAHPEGRWGWAHTRGEVARRDAAGNPLWAVGSTMNITARKYAEIALQEEKNRFEIIFNSTPEVMIISRVSDGYITHINEAAIQMSGYSRAEILGNTTLNLGVWRRAEDRQRMLEPLSKTGRCHNVEVEVTSKAGEVFIASVSAVVTALDGVPHIVSTVRDVTERRRLEAELQRSEALLRSTLESTDEGILMIAQDGHVLSANKRFMELWHVPQTLIEHANDELLLAHVLQQLRDPDAFMRQVQRLYNSHEESRDILQFKDGRVFARFTRALSVDEERGRIWCFKDVTEEAHTQAALAEREEMFRSIFAQASDGILLVDAESKRIVEFNDAACADLGYSREEFSKFGIPDIQAEYDKQQIADVDRKILASGAMQFETLHKHKDGGTRIVQVSSKPIRLQGKQYLVSLVSDITARKQHEEMVRANEQKMLTILDNVDAFIYLKDTQGNYLFANRKVRELWHAEMTDIVGYGDEKFFDAETAANIRSNDSRVLVGGEIIKAEETNTVPSTGNTFTYISTKLPLRREDGSIYALCGISTDITERIQIEDSLRASEQRLNLALSATQMGVWEFDFATRKLYWSDEIFRHFGMKRFEPSLEKLHEWVHPDDVAIPHQAMSHAINERAAYFAVYRLVVNGKTYWAEDRGEVQYDQDGQAVKVIGTAQDITARKNSEMQLLIAATAFESQEGMMVCDAQANILKVNQAFTTITGYSAQEVLGKNPRMLSSGLQDRNFYKAMWESINTTGAWKGELINKRKNGETYPEFLMITAVKDKDGKVTNYVGAQTDSSERQMVMEQLRAAAIGLEAANVQIEEERALLAQRVEERTVQLRYANQAKDSFLATMSHEIRTPLGGLLGMMELLGMSKLDHEQGEMLAAARKSGKSLLRIVDDILDWSKIEAKKLVLAPQVSSVEEMLNGVMNTYAQLAASKGIELKLDMTSGANAYHYFDALRVSQILNNFTSNAIKFTSRGAVTIKLEWMGGHNGFDNVRISVSDSGIGIAPEQRERLFRHYEQASADTARMYGGTGLGLSICSSLAELMEATIEVESVPKVGSTFSLNLILPIANVARDKPTNAMAQRSHDEADSFTRLVSNDQEVSLLVVDDHAVNRMLLKQQLEILGLHVEVAADGIEALSLWQAGKFDLIITDCHMPEMDGYELTERIRDEERRNQSAHIPIIAWTANALADEVTNCRRAGMDDLMTKPTEMSVLKSMLSKWLVKAKVLDLPDVDAAPMPEEEQTPSLIVTLDMKVLKKISARHEAQVELLQEFNKENRLDIINLNAALQAGDAVAVARSAHRIKGASRMVGALQLEDLSTRIEKLAKQEDILNARFLADKSLDDIVSRLETAIEEVAHMN